MAEEGFKTWRNPFENAEIVYLDSVTSTMDVAHELITRSSVSNGTTIVADYQTAGRGRFVERRWFSSRGKNLLFTSIFLIESIPFFYLRVPVLLGGIIANLINQFYDLETRLKWPNDIVVEFGDAKKSVKKLGGILCEAKKGYLLAGIGINCNESFTENDVEYFDKSSAVSLKMLLDREISRVDLLYNILLELKRELFEDYRGDRWQARLQKLLYGVGEIFTIAQRESEKGGHIETKPVVGKIVGVGKDGELLVMPDSKEIVKVISGEIIGVY